MGAERRSRGQSMLSSLVGRIRKFSLSQDDAPYQPTDIAKPVLPQFDVARLPAEIRLSLLKSADDLFSLRCLATSSAAFLLVYNENRQTVLDEVMGRPMDLSLVPESAFASATSRINFEAADVASQIARFLQKYHQRKESSTPGRITGLFNKAEQAQHMKNLYSTVDALCTDFCTRASQHIGVSPDSITYASLSKSERHRLHRAFFRYELFSNLYRDQGICLDYNTRRYAPGLLSYNKNFVYRDDYDEAAVDDENMAKDFLQPFAPEDVEEFAAIHDYSMRRWAEIMAEHAPYFAAERASLAANGDGQGPIRVCLMPSSWTYNGYRRHFSVLGLDFLHTFLDNYTSVEERQILIRHNVYYGTCDPNSVVEDYRYRREQRWREQRWTEEPATLAQEYHWGGRSQSLGNRKVRRMEPRDRVLVQFFNISEMNRRGGCVFWDEERVYTLAETVLAKREGERAARYAALAAAGGGTGGEAQGA